ncbi:MAG: Flp pilus assembly complex ATPase component TadA [Endomicrobium sp.]|jgi:Tfp pilus assembly pilus retraction ATPase PilT|nr:Flp pilus assembly complex ATPase component TadA [Endomicrobium sp.]
MRVMQRMLSLNGVLSASVLDIVRTHTFFMFKNAGEFKTPEALVIYEQNLLSEDDLFDLCQKEYGLELCKPEVQYVPKDIVNQFVGFKCVPLRYDLREKVIHVGVLPEFDTHIQDVMNLRVEKSYIPIHYFNKLFIRYYGMPWYLNKVPIRDKLDLIIEEALQLKASDITITTIASGALIYYNCRKKKVMSRRVIETSDVEEIANLLAVKANSPVTEIDNMPKYLSVSLDRHTRGRVVLNRTYYGRAITIRILPDDVLTLTLEELNINDRTVAFIREEMLSEEKGLRLFVGETMSGKNTTILSALQELVNRSVYKVVSIESPVEILVDGIEQINVETEEEYKENTTSLLRQNPDIVYIGEITAHTAVDAINTANTGKVVFSSIHANSISDVLARLQDITGMSFDRLILSLHSCVYQKLVRNEYEDKVYPKNRCVYFSDKVKNDLYGKSLGEIKQYLMKLEGDW